MAATAETVLSVAWQGAAANQGWERERACQGQQFGFQLEQRPVALQALGSVASEGDDSRSGDSGVMQWQERQRQRKHPRQRGSPQAAAVDQQWS